MAIVDIVVIILILLGGLIGFKKGALKKLVSFISILATAIIAYQIKEKLIVIIIKNLPFVNFAGKYQGLYSVNIIFYDIVCFAVVYILIYCLLSILLNVSGLLKLLDNLDIVYPIPSRIGGVLFGAIENLIFSFLIMIVLLCVPQTNKYVMESTVSKMVVERTPIINLIFRGEIGVAENIYLSTKDYTYESDEASIEKNLEIVRYYIRYEIVESDVMNECIKSEKLHLGNVVVAS